MKISLLLIVLFVSACATKPKSIDCPESAKVVLIPKKEAEKIQGNVSQFLSDARITQEPREDGQGILWRFSNMPDHSVYYLMGLREGDAIYKTNLGEQTSSLNLISDLSGVATGTTNCLWISGKDKTNSIIKVLVDTK